MARPESSFCQRWKSAGMLLCCFLAACEGNRWNPLQAHREVQEGRQNQQRVTEELARLPDPRVVAQAHQRIGFHGRPGNPAWIMLDLGRSLQPDEIVLLSARVSDPAPDDPIGGFPPEVTCSLSETGIEGSFKPVATWHEENEGAGRDLPLLRLPNNGQFGRYLKIEVSGARVRSRGRFFTLGEIVVLEKGINRALGVQVTTGPSIENAPRWTAANLTDGHLWCGSLVGVERSPMNGFHSVIESSPDAVPKWVEVDLGASTSVDEIRLVPARPSDYADIAGFGFPPSFQVIAHEEDLDTGQALFEGTMTNPGDATVCLPGRGVQARRIRIVATSLWQRSQDYIFALAELQVYSKGLNVALGKVVTASDFVPSSIWSKPALVDGFSSQRELLDWPAWLAAVERRLFLEREQTAIESKVAEAEERFQEALFRGSLVLFVTLILLGGGLLIGSLWHQSRERARLRQRIARDLHDEMGSQLSHLALLAEAGKQRGETAGDSFACIASEARDLQDTMRDLVWLLEPQSGEARDFAVRLRTTCQRLLAPAISDVQIETAGTPPSRRLPLEWTRDLLLFIKEALNNCARHSQASSARISLAWNQTHFEWKLRDDGLGFDETASDFEPGAGLRNLRLRAEALQADLDLVSAPKAGTQITLQVPLPQRRRFRLFDPS